MLFGRKNKKEDSWTENDNKVYALMEKRAACLNRLQKWTQTVIIRQKIQSILLEDTREYKDACLDVLEAKKMLHEAITDYNKAVNEYNESLKLPDRKATAGWVPMNINTDTIIYAYLKRDF